MSHHGIAMFLFYRKKICSRLIIVLLINNKEMEEKGRSVERIFLAQSTDKVSQIYENEIENFLGWLEENYANNLFACWITHFLSIDERLSC
jgi:hypothetical protein